LAANYPFATIEPNIGVVPVPDKRLAKLAEAIEKSEGKKPPQIPATVEFVDIAGLVAGASQGQGLGNKFLSHIRPVSIICQVLRVFPDPDVIHVSGDVNPNRDREILETELILADLQTLAKQKEPRYTIDNKQLARWKLIKRTEAELNKGKKAIEVLTSDEDGKLLRDLHLLTAKPILYVINVSEAQLQKKISDEVSLKGLTHSIAICAKTESELADLSTEDQSLYLKQLGLESSGLDRIINIAYKMLDLVSFLTAGVIETRAWTIKKGTKAPQAAGVIHTDFEKKFIKADIADINTFFSLGGWVKCREAGKVRTEGKDYEIKDGEVVEFKIGT